jgi:hypothetical protein
MTAYAVRFVTDENRPQTRSAADVRRLQRADGDDLRCFLSFKTDQMLCSSNDNFAQQHLIIGR